MESVLSRITSLLSLPGYDMLEMRSFIDSHYLQCHLLQLHKLLTSLTNVGGI